MKRDLSQLRKQHKQTAMCEISTVAQAINVEQRLGLVKLYRQLNLEQAAQSELNRLWRQFPQHQAILVALLDILTKQKTIALLTSMVGFSQRVANPSAALRLAMALALIAIKRFDAAAVQYAELVKSREIIPQLSQQLAEFVCVHPPTPVLITALNEYIYSMNNDHLSPLLYYVLCRVLETQDCPDIDMYLNRIRDRDIQQSEIAFDLARLSFRYCKWDRAMTAAKRVLRISPKHESAKSILVSAYSFAGRLNKAANCIRKLTKSYSPLLLRLDQLSTILESVGKQNKPLPTTDVNSNQIGLDNTNKLGSGDIDDICSKIVEQYEKQNQKVTVSMVGTDQVNARPWDILVRNNWSYPHIMVQKKGGCHILHAFIPSDGPDCWRWQEVPIFIKGGQADKGILFIPADIDLYNQSAPFANNLYQQFEKELESDYIQKELQ